MRTISKIVYKTKIHRIRNQQIRECCGVQPINEWVEKRREWDEHVTRMGAERLINISRDSITPDSISPELSKRKWSDLIPG